MAVPAAVAAWLFKNMGATTSPQDSSANPVIDIIGSRTSNTASALYIDGVNTTNASGADNGALPAFKPCFGARGTSNTTADKFAGCREQVSFFGSSLTPTDVANLRARIASLKTALGR